MIKQIIELIMVVIIGFLPVANEAPQKDASPAASLTATVTSQQMDGVKIARFENMLNHNYCFGDDFSDNDKLLSAAFLSLANNIKGGRINAALVDGFIYNMYGAQPQNSTDGFYDVLPTGYDVYNHSVTSFDYNGDGTITVRSIVTVNPDTRPEQYDCTSVFYANGESAFSYNLISCDINW